jgi:hypothetical protein
MIRRNYIDDLTATTMKDTQCIQVGGWRAVTGLWWIPMQAHDDFPQNGLAALLVPTNQAPSLHSIASRWFLPMQNLIDNFGAALILQLVGHFDLQSLRRYPQAASSRDTLSRWHRPRDRPYSNLPKFNSLHHAPC